MKPLGDHEAFEFYRGLLEYLRSGLRAESYLEIGLGGGQTFNRIAPHCVVAHGVDPNPPPVSAGQVFSMTSDEYFRANRHGFDLVWIDGDHSHHQVLRDVNSALDRLNPGGVLLAHDMFPPDVEHTNPQNCSDAYKAAIALRQDPDYEVYTLPVRFGVTLIGRVGTAFPWVHA